MITLILQTADLHDIVAAKRWTADNLHVPVQVVTNTVAVAYVCKHFEMGALSGWDGFIENNGG